MASSKKSYDVFLSFRGPDVRNNFLSHLQAALDRNGIYTFVDSEELRKGKQISRALIRAIKDSSIAIVIFSKDYASSWWCLEELVKIMECRARKELIVLPLFYKVEPREVRGRRKVYGRAIDKHEIKFGKGAEKVKRWKKALFEAGNLSGWHFNVGNEAELIERILKELSSHLERTLLHVAKYEVGIDSRVKEVISLSQKESGGDDVLMIGLWGPGGIGKTTLAKAIYNAIGRPFQGSSFLERVRENSNNSNGLIELQEKLLSQILSPRHLTVHSVDGGISLIRDRLPCKKVLLILDDVDHLCQLNALAGKGDWFGKGSRIFVTSRDKHLLTSHGINLVYEVKPLDHERALDLFNRHAFSNCKKPEIRKDLIDRALHYASGLPLALEVLGSFLHGRDELEWEGGLRKLSKNPIKNINQILKTSFDGLENDEKEMFLDIACFLKGKSTEYIKRVLNSCDFEAPIGIKILIERSLIREEHETLQMHDLVQLMGQDVVNQECPGYPGKRSRLWLFEDVQVILCEGTETNSVKAIVLDLCAPKVTTMNHGGITIGPNALRNMKMLRMLILIDVDISPQGPVCLPDNLRWLEWPNAPVLEFGTGREKLVGLDIQKSHIREFDAKSKIFKWLKFINFSQCKSLISVPDVSSIPNLENLNLDGCKSLGNVHDFVTRHDKLKLLSLRFCSNLSEFPPTLEAKSLQTLDLFSCYKLKKFSNISEKMEHLEKLYLGWTDIEELPTSIENLSSVKIIDLRKCKELRTLPSSVYKLQNLEHLNLAGCSNFVMFPTNHNGNLGFRNLFELDLYGCNLSNAEFLESFSSFPKLRRLDLSKNKCTHLPTGINKYHDLEHLIVHKCKQLQKIPQLPPNLRILWADGCRSLQEFPDLSSLSSDYLDVDLTSCRELFRRGASTAHVLPRKELSKTGPVYIRLTGKEMPEWFFHGKGKAITVTVPEDLRDKFLGIAFCFVFRAKEGKAVETPCHVSITGQEQFSRVRRFLSMKSDTVVIDYLPLRELNIKRKLNWSDFDFYPVLTGLIKWGFRPITEQEEDDQRIMVQYHQPDETNRSSEERDLEEDNWIDSDEEERSSENDWVIGPSQMLL